MLCFSKELAIYLDKKHPRSVVVFLDVTVNQVGSHHELLTLGNKRKKVREYVSVVYECICSSTPKENALRNFVTCNKVKISI